MTTSPLRANSIHWFRKGLRLHDNPGLVEALRYAKEGKPGSASGKLYPLYILDGDSFQLRHCTALRANFVVECLADLDASLRSLGSRLYVARGDPVAVLPELWSEWDVSQMTFEADESGEPYAKARDAAVFRAGTSAGVVVRSFASETLFELERYVAVAGPGGVPETMASYQSLLKRCGAPAVPLPAPKAADFEQVAGGEEGKDAAAAWETKMLPPGAATELPWPRNTPRSEVACVWSAADCAGLAPVIRGGETEALARLSTCMKRSTWVATYEKPKTAPTALDPSTTALSPHMSLGCLSPRTMWYAVEASAAEAPSSVTRSKPPVSLHGQLMWRDFNTLIAYSANAHSPGSWGRMEGNKYCRSIPWDTDPALLTAWKEGRTGYPWIDACMAQLRQEGWIHHLGRHAVACFLTRGDLWQHWEEGAAHFEAHLLDADYALNTFNWLWLSCSGFFYQYFRCYSPVAMQKKNDPTGRYIRKYVPQLRNMPDKYIYEPWLAPAGVQKSAGCVVGVDYPAPVVDHKVISKENMGRMAAAYEAHKAKHGTGTAAKKKKASTSKSSSQSKKTKKTTDETDPKKTKRLKQTKLAP